MNTLNSPTYQYNCFPNRFILFLEKYQPIILINVFAATQADIAFIPLYLKMILELKQKNETYLQSRVREQYAHTVQTRKQI